MLRIGGPWREAGQMTRFALLHLSALSVLFVPFRWSHVGWVLSPRHDRYDAHRIADFGRFPELRWLDRHHWLPTVTFGALVWLAGGLTAFVWGYLLSTVLLYHATFAINSVAHIWGTRRFATADHSRNNWWLAVLTPGEGWHNNHHYCMSSARQGLRWWELDLVIRKPLGPRASAAPRASLIPVP